MEIWDEIVLQVVTTGIISSSLGDKYTDEWEYELDGGSIVKLVAWRGKNRRGRYKVVPLKSPVKQEMERILGRLTRQADT